MEPLKAIEEQHGKNYMPNTSREARLIDAFTPAFDEDWGITARYQWSKNRRVMWCPAEDKLMIIGLLTVADQIGDISKICDKVNTMVLPSKNGKQIKLRHCNLAKGTKRKPKRQQANLICTLRALLTDCPGVSAPGVSRFAQEYLQPKKSKYPFKEIPPPAVQHRQPTLSTPTAAGHPPGMMMQPGMLTTQQVATVLTVAALMPQPQLQQGVMAVPHTLSHVQQHAGGARVTLQPTAAGFATAPPAGSGIALLTQAASETLVPQGFKGRTGHASSSEDSMFIENFVGPSVASAGLGAGDTPAAAVLAAAGSVQPTVMRPAGACCSDARPRRTNVFSHAVVPEDTMDAEMAAGTDGAGRHLPYCLVAAARRVCVSAPLLHAHDHQRSHRYVSFGLQASSPAG